MLDLYGPLPLNELHGNVKELVTSVQGYTIIVIYRYCLQSFPSYNWKAIGLSSKLGERLLASQKVSLGCNCSLNRVKQ